MNIYKIVALISIVGLLSYAVLLYARPVQTDADLKAKEQVIQLASSAAQTRFFFSPSLVHLTPGQSKDIAIMISTGANLIQQSQIELKYNPALLSVTNIRAGSFFKTPLLILTEHDLTRGRINYVFSETEASPTHGTGQLAILTLTTAPEASGSSKTYLNFLPKSTAQNTTFRRSLLQSTEDLLIDIQPATPQP